MDVKQIVGNFLRGLMVILVAVSFAMFFDVFVIDTHVKDSKRFAREISSDRADPEEVIALKSQHERYMNKGIDLGGYDFSQKSISSHERIPLKLPRTEVDVAEAEAIPLSKAEGKDAFDTVLAMRPSILEPVQEKDKEAARVANFGVKVDGSSAEDVAEIEPASGGGAVKDAVPDAALVLMPVKQTAENETAEITDTAATVEKEVVAEPIVETEKIIPLKADGKVRVVIIIDDMGVSPANSTKVENLPAPLTLSYLPYAKNLPERTKRAKENGHELMVHMPMQPLNSAMDGGPAVLKEGMNDAKFQEVLTWGLSQFDGYVGVNNHMGSRLTKDRAAMEKVMAELSKRDVYFIDSKTIGSSVASDVAEKAGLKYADRDVFLDHEISDSYIAAALKELEAKAWHKGYAIAIGHPHPQTISALEKWLPTLAAKGIELVPASAVVHRDERYIKVVHIEKAQDQSDSVISQ